MRFPAAIAPKQPLRNVAATQFIRRLVGGPPATPPRPAPVRQQDQDTLPAALDERVRLIGEW